MDKKKFTDGIHVISNEEYHSSEGVSRSGLMLLKQSPYHYWRRYLDPRAETSQGSKAMYMGSLVHTLTLEPELYENEYVVAPEINKRTSAGKEEWAKFQDDNEGKKIITAEQYDQAFTMSCALKEKTFLSDIYDDSKKEVSIFFTHEPTGLQCKVRPDVWFNNIVLDVKTTKDASFNVYKNEVFRYGYHIQAAMIYKALESIGVTMEKFVMSCVETTEPHHITADYVLSDEALDYGVNVFDELMVRFKECCEQDRWPAYSTKLIELPAWLKYEEI